MNGTGPKTAHSRRTVMMGVATLPLAACSNGLGSGQSEVIDARVDRALNFLYAEVPGARQLGQEANGILVMPLVTEAGFGFGGSYGRGALRINGATVDYYSVASGSFGLQIGAQQYAHALFFMTEEALFNFRRSPGWAAGANVQYAVNTEADNLGVETTTLLDPVIAVVFGQAGLIAGASLEGLRYTRILP